MRVEELKNAMKKGDDFPFNFSSHFNDGANYFLLSLLLLLLLSVVLGKKLIIMHAIFLFASAFHCEIICISQERVERREKKKVVKQKLFDFSIMKIVQF